MSDTGRKDLTDKAKETVVPDSTKSESQKVKEGVTDTSDKVAGSVQGDQTKSTTQQTSDTLEHRKDTGTSSGGIVDSIKKTVGMDKDSSAAADKH